VCSGAGGDCWKECRDGKVYLTSCPRKLVDVQTFQALGFVDLYKKGIPLVPGGSLDQPAGFVNLCQLVWGEEARHQIDAMKGD
jgi:hypothetical protein